MDEKEKEKRRKRLENQIEFYREQIQKYSHRLAELLVELENLDEEPGGS
jgi:chromosome segregation ATPase